MYGKFLQGINKILVTYHDLERPLEKSAGYGPVIIIIIYFYQLDTGRHTQKALT